MKTKKGGKKMERDYYIETGSTIYLFVNNPEELDRHTLANRFQKKIIIIDRKDFKEMKLLLLPDIIKAGLFLKNYTLM